MAAGDPGELHDLLLELVRSVGLLHVVDPGSGLAASPSEAFALHELDCNAGLAQQDLAARLRLEKSTVSRLVASLEQRGLVVRERDPGNRRIWRLRITDEGRAAHSRVGAAFHQRHLEVLSGMTQRERVALSVGLSALLRNLRPAAPGSRPLDHTPVGYTLNREVRRTGPSGGQ